MVKLTGFMALLVALVFVVPVATQDKTEVQRPPLPYGLGQKEQVAEFANAIALLRLHPLASNTCSSYERWTVSWMIDEYASKYFKQEVFDQLYITPEETKRLKAESLHSLLASMTLELRQKTRTPHVHCIYEVPESVSDWGPEKLDYDNEWILVATIEGYKDQDPKIDWNKFKDLANDLDVSTALVRYANTKHLVATFLSGESKGKEESKDAGWELAQILARYKSPSGPIEGMTSSLKARITKAFDVKK